MTMTFGQRPEGDERVGYVDTWKTFSPIVINIAMLFILFTLPERAMVGVEDKAEHGFDLVIHCFLCFLITHFF